MRSDSFSDTTWGFADVIPQFSLRWNAGVNNFMTYVTGDIPVGAYQSTRLANLGLGHGAIDAGGGYTYFNPATGPELSAVLGFTYNFVNPSTQYQSGVDMHLDWGASQFLTKQVQVGLVGTPTRNWGATAALATGSGASCRRCSASGRSSATSFRSAKASTGTSISRDTRNSEGRLARPGGTAGSHLPSRPQRRLRPPVHRMITK
ncbi:transporter [Bradyrhizobium sp. 18]|uniref:SphA family protein n=1 Tax=Bradyrhizobium sp. 18 TaxID=2782657 RepID=UPI003211B541